MKIRLTFIMISILTASITTFADDAFSKEKGIVKSVMQYSRYNGIKQNIYSYDSKGNISMWLVRKKIGQYFIDTVRTIYSYDRNSKEQSIITEIYNGANWDPIKRITKVNDENGNLLSEWVEIYKDGVWHKEKHNLNTYDKSYKIEIFYTSATGIKNILHQAAIVKLYPNPATDYIDVMLNEAKEPVLSVKVYDVLGNVVVDTPPGPLLIEGERIRLDVSGLAAGVYFVKIGNKMYKFVKM